MTRFEVMRKATWKAIDTIQDSGYNVGRFTVDEVAGTITIYVPERWEAEENVSSNDSI